MSQSVFELNLRRFRKTSFKSIRYSYGKKFNIIPVFNDRKKERLLFLAS
jgi:hypothetical protein